MNPLTNVKNITKLNERELALGISGKSSWHNMYKDSAWIFIGGLPYGITEGDVLTVFSQYGEIANLNLVRDKKTGKSKGFCFLCYIDQKSTILAVDNFNGIKICGRIIRVDHVANYKPPKENDDDDEITKMLHAEGCAPKPAKLPVKEETVTSEHKKVKEKILTPKHKKVKKEKKKRRHRSSSSSSVSHSEETINLKRMKIKKEKVDTEYEKHEFSSKDMAQVNKHGKVRLSSDSESSADSCDYQTKLSKHGHSKRWSRSPHYKSASTSHTRNHSVNQFTKYSKPYDKESYHAHSHSHSSNKQDEDLCYRREENEKSRKTESNNHGKEYKSRHYSKVEAKSTSDKEYVRKDSRKYDSYSSSKQYRKKDLSSDNLTDRNYRYSDKT